MKAERIPALDSPYGSGAWQQPSAESVEIDSTHALMTRATFEQLLEYSGTLPTGVYVGKMWRRREAARWFLGWFGHSAEPDLCSINWREVLIA